MPVHYATEGHLCTHASKLYRVHKIAIGVLTDQASEQYNQLVKHDVACGHGSAANGRMSSKVTYLEGNPKPAYSDNKFWIEIHRLHRIFVKHNSKWFNYKPRNFRKCPRCGNSDHTGYEHTECPKHPLYKPP